jgi:hypothetical protein
VGAVQCVQVTPNQRRGRCRSDELRVAREAWGSGPPSIAPTVTLIQHDRHDLRFAESDLLLSARPRAPRRGARSKRASCSQCARQEHHFAPVLSARPGRAEKRWRHRVGPRCAAEDRPPGAARPRCRRRGVAPGSRQYCHDRTTDRYRSGHRLSCLGRARSSDTAAPPRCRTPT